MTRFPSVKARRLLAVLMREPLAYRVVRQSGSHRRLVSDRYPPITFASHDRDSLPPRRCGRSTSRTWDCPKRMRWGYSEQMKAVRVIYHYEDGSWWAESPDVERWTAGGASYDEVRKLAEDGVRFALDREDVEVEHYLPERFAAA